ncbi:MAG: hypothetical protein AB1722_04595 [Pseudomonadota bacterium]
MNKLLRYIPLFEAQAGMRLAAPIQLIRHGRLTLSFAAGHELTQGSIEQLIAHGAEYIAIHQPDLRTPEQKKADREAAMQRVNAIFAGAPLQDPTLGALYTQLLLYRSAP